MDDPPVPTLPVCDGPPVNPLLKPTHRPLWRDRTTVQLGLGAERALVLTGVDGRSVAALRALDGARDADDLRRSGAVPAALLDLLLGAQCLDEPATSPPPRLGDERALLGLVHPAPGAADRVLAARRAARVTVVGGGRVGAVVAHLLAASSVGRVTVHDPAAVRAEDACPGGLSESDVGLRRGAAATALAVRALSPTLDAGPPDVVVLCPDGAAPPDPSAWRPLHAGGAAVLCAAVRETTGVVGPFTPPGGTGCPDCLGLHRADRDPAWPLVERQLADPDRAPAPTAAAVIAVATAATASAEVLAWLDGRTVPRAHRPASEQATLELSLPGWQWRRRWWGPHPQCRCVTGAAPAGQGTQ